MSIHQIWIHTYRIDIGYHCIDRIDIDTTIRFGQVTLYTSNADDNFRMVSLNLLDLGDYKY